MRLLKILLIIPALGIFIAPAISCNSQSAEAQQPEYQTVTVQRGDLTIDITAAGNLALSRTEDLAVDLFYGKSGTAGTKGTIGEVLVEEGDTVTEGQVLVTLDKNEWDDQLTNLEDAVTAAERNVTAKKRALTAAGRQVTTLERQVKTKEDNVMTAERQVDAKEFAVLQAELDVQTAEYNLSQIEDVKKVQDDIDDAEYALKFAKSMMGGAYGGGVQFLNYSYWSNLAAIAEDDLEESQRDMQEILDGTSIRVTDDVALQVATKQLAVEQSQRELEDAETAVDTAKSAVEDAQLAVEDAKYAVEDAKLNIEDATNALEDAQRNLDKAQSSLDDAKSLSPEVKAPFDGFITKVNVNGGDEVLNGTIAVQLADPNKFEADILVNETDISKIEVGGEASVSVDSLQGVTLPATVTHISPTATIQSGVVNYKVKVEIKSLEAIAQEAQQARQQAMANIAAGELPAPLQQAIDEGRLTREQVDEMIKQRQAATAGQSGQGQVPQTQIPTMTPADIQLREGLSVTVTIIVAQETDVLLVPNAAVTTEGRQSYVQVVTETGETEKRAVQTGLSDWQSTEITDGLSEGEQILVPQGTAAATTTTTTQQGAPRGIFFGGPPR